MPKKARGCNFGRKTKGAKRSAERRRNPDFADAERLRSREYRRWKSQEIRLKKEDRLGGFIQLSQFMVKLHPFPILSIHHAFNTISMKHMTTWKDERILVHWTTNYARHSIHHHIGSASDNISQYTKQRYDT